MGRALPMKRRDTLKLQYLEGHYMNNREHNASGPCSLEEVETSKTNFVGILPYYS